MNIHDAVKQYFFDVYKRFPIDVDRGEGAYLFGKDGSKYLDFLSGIAVNALGYNHPAILSALEKQMKRNLHLSNYFIQDIQVELAARLVELTPFSKVFFTNSGTEAIEGLLKVVKKYARQNNKNEIIAFEGSFHGRSLGALSITIQEKYQGSFLPLLPDIITVPFNNAAALEKAISSKTAAIFFEGITGEGGVRPVSDEIFAVMKQGRDTYGYLIIADEIQTGVGRTGKFYHFEHTPLIPDAIATAKGLGGGLPLGAFMVREHLSEIFARGEHGTTYGGNPLACAAGLATINTVADKQFLNSIEPRGNYFKLQLQRIAEEFKDQVVDVRGMGLMLGMELKEAAQSVMDEAFRQGLIINIAGGNTLRFVPPLIVDEKLIDEACNKLHKTLKFLFP
jgi:acetylornithine/N-succinyldiaminopimelate aminotransferase